MTMSEMMDQARDELHKIGEQKNELERLWKTEKHNWGLEKKVVTRGGHSSMLAFGSPKITKHSFDKHNQKQYYIKRYSIGYYTAISQLGFTMLHCTF